MSEEANNVTPPRTRATEEDKTQDERSLSPTASPFVPTTTSTTPVFIPKWKQQAAGLGASGGHGGNKSSEDEGEGKGGVHFSHEMPSRSLSGSFNARTQNRSRNPTSKSPMRQNSAMPPLRSNSWREEREPSWRSSPQAERREAGNRDGGQGGEDSKTSKAITVEHRLIRPGAYSTWIRVLSADIGAQQLASVLSRCEESNAKGAIHVYLREKFINRQLVQQLKSQGYKFHHYVEDTETFVYGKRPQDSENGRELMNATSKELIGSLVLSPDHTQVLLVWEQGKWMYTTGCASTRETLIDALKREIRRDLNLEIEKSFLPQAVGGWHRAAAKFDCINETFMCFAVQATSVELNLDEDTHARWFSVSELLQLLDMVDEQFKEANISPKLDSAIEHPPGNIFSHLALRWLKAFTQGAGWPATSTAERHIFCLI